MRRCLELAARGAGHVAPNPMVGAVLVYGNRIIGEGWHRQYGEAHAEVNCINSVTEEDRPFISESILYVSLEPCAHFGKTPPCTNLIIEQKIPETVIGCRDSYAEVNGKGIVRLQEAGVKVITGVMEKECLELNKRFFTFHEKQRPYIILKWAQSNNKKIAAASGGRVFISNEFSNRLVHKWRTEEAAILVGTNTALHDDPALTARLWPGKNPLRLVIDQDLKLPHSLNLFNGKFRTFVFNCVKQEDAGMVIYHKINKEKKLIPQVMAILYAQQVQSVIVEGGAKLLQSFIDENMWDEARVITNTSFSIENGLVAPILFNNPPGTATQVQSDIIETYFR